MEPGRLGRTLIQGMKKFLLYCGVTLLVLVAVAYIGVAFFLGSMVKGAVNRLGPRLAGTNVELVSATISPLSGTGTLGGLTVGNPPGWSGNRALYLGRAHIEVQPSSLFKDVIVINELTIEEPEFNYETHIVSSNISDLLANIEKYTGSGSDTDKSSGSGKKFIVKKLRFINGKATVGVGIAALPVPLPEIQLDNIGMAEGGVTGARLSAIILGDVLKTVVKAATDARGLTGADSYEKTKEAARQLSESVKGLFKEKKP